MASDKKLEFHSPETLQNVARELPEAEEKPLFTTTKGGAYTISEADADVRFHADQVESHKVVYNAADGDIFGVTTAEYEIIQPTEFLDPLVDQLDERGRDDVRGFINLRDGGAWAYGELLFDADKFWPPDRTRSDDPVRCGMTLRYSHDGGVSVRASGFAQDGMCRNTMRKVTDSVYVKHAGDVEGRIDWDDEWSTVLGQLGVFSEALADVIGQAMGFELWDLSGTEWDGEWIELTDPQDAIEEIPTPPGIERRDVYGLNAFYDFLGFPKYLALAATDRLVWRLTQADGHAVSAWDAYQGATYALSHNARFEAGSSSDEDYHRTASDILLNPRRALEQAERELHSRATPDDAQAQLGIEATVGEALEAYEEREQRLREAFD